MNNKRKRKKIKKKEIKKKKNQVHTYTKKENQCKSLSKSSILQKIFLAGQIFKFCLSCTYGLGYINRVS
jgi:hypothetical protein